MRSMRAVAWVVVGTVVAGCSSSGEIGGASELTVRDRREQILSMRDRTMEDLYRMKPGTKEEVAKAPGYAVFDETGVYVVLAMGETGKGVVTDHAGKTTFLDLERVGSGARDEKGRTVVVFRDRGFMESFKSSGARGEALRGQSVSVYRLTDTEIVPDGDWGKTEFVPDEALNGP